MTARRLAVFLLTLAIAGCGGSRRAAPPTQAGPRIPGDLARRLAAETDAVAAALHAGDCSKARRLALALRADTTRSIGRVPSRLVEDLSTGVNVLVDDIHCPAPAAGTTAEGTTSTGSTTEATTTAETTTAEQPPEPGPGKKKGHHKRGKQGDEGGD